MKKNWKLFGAIAAVAIIGVIFSNINNWKYNAVDYGKESTQTIISETNNLFIMLADEYLDDDDLSELYREEDIFTRLSN